MGALSLLKLVALGAAVAGGLPAGTLTISPVSVVLARGQTSAMVKVANSRSNPIVMQAQIFRWTQDGDKDALTATSDVILSPPMATIPGGAEQVLRLLMRPGKPADAAIERHYRMLLGEIPAAGASPGDLSFAMRVSIPVFVTPDQPIVPALEWRAVRGQGDQIVLTVVNTGSAYDRIIALSVAMPGGAAVAAVPLGTNTYILPGARRRWTVDGKITNATVNLTVVVRAGRSTMSLPIES
ncbi:fimbria/pilus periplasmic chaperone [Novosphingobium sp.]|uniref:fimbrial biogenesis chaperone n=1 Tax=Novosphingobium sp. TaxID=1874826 RepID=UPI0033415931